ncbi:hypothetical protein B5G50_28220 [Brevibacillus brevis]|nr:hypothetical protein B5G50_28220 [Brevibacillus brevis]
MCTPVDSVFLPFRFRDTFEGESINEIKEQLKSDKEYVQLKTAWDKEDENWYGKTYVTWAGLTGNGKEFKYNFYIEFEWSSTPFQKMTDHFALHWGDKGTKYASADWTVVQYLGRDGRYGGNS